MLFGWSWTLRDYGSSGFLHRKSGDVRRGSTIGEPMPCSKRRVPQIPAWPLLPAPEDFACLRNRSESLRLERQAEIQGSWQEHFEGEAKPWSHA